MALVFIILSVWLFAEKWSARLDVHRYRRSLEAALGSATRSLGLSRNLDRLSELREILDAPGGAIEEWIIVDETGRTVTGGPQAPRVGLIDVQAVHMRYDVSVPFDAPRGKRWRLFARSSGLGGTISGGMGEMLLVVALGTLFLVTMLYGLMDRLVLRPLSEVVAAAQKLERGGVPGKLLGEERFDEVGTLLRSFNRMAQEVGETRMTLESRVADAVSQYRGAQRQLAVAQRLSATGKLAAGIAHEINNPLGGMMNAARSIRGSATDGTREAEYAELILDGLDRIGRTVQGMLQFSRAASPEDVGPVSVESIVEAARGFCLHRLREEGIELEVSVPEGLPPVTGEQHELQQVVLNLLVNAIDAVVEGVEEGGGGEGGVGEKRISVSARAEGERVEMFVRDTGPGMDEKTLEQAFDIFFTTKGPETGTGLGLSVVHQIVTDHGGEVSLESKPGEGTTVTVSLPVARSADDGEKA